MIKYGWNSDVIGWFQYKLQIYKDFAKNMGQFKVDGKCVGIEMLDRIALLTSHISLSYGNVFNACIQTNKPKWRTCLYNVTLILRLKSFWDETIEIMNIVLLTAARIDIIMWMTSQLRTKGIQFNWNIFVDFQDDAHVFLDEVHRN